MKLTSTRFMCDLCHATVQDSQVYPMAEGDPYQHLCHDCILNGWISFCGKCWHSCQPSELDINFHCKNCQKETEHAAHQLSQDGPGSDRGGLHPQG